VTTPLRAVTTSSDPLAAARPHHDAVDSALAALSDHLVHGLDAPAVGPADAHQENKCYDIYISYISLGVAGRTTSAFPTLLVK
jgi:hypothetical protein